MSPRLAAAEENAAVWVYMPTKPGEETVRPAIRADQRKSVHK